MAEVVIYSTQSSPFAHRSRLVLQEKGIDFEVVEVDLQNKPEEFKKISLYGKVPTIKHGDHLVWESAIINEYLEEVFPNPPLLSSNAIDKAQARIWIDFANTRLAPAFTKLLRNTEPQIQQEAIEELYKHLEFIENEGLGKLSGDGPYWFGESVSLVDFAVYPWFERWPALEEFRGFSIPSKFARLLRWRDAVSQRDSVKAIANPKEFYVERYSRFTTPNSVAAR